MKVIGTVLSLMSAAALVLTGGYSVYAQDYDKSGYCPVTKGMTLEYVNYDADGARTGSYVLHVSAVTGTLAEGTVVFDQYFYDADGDLLFDDNGGNLPMEVTVGGPDGTVSRMSDVGKVMKVQDIMSKGDASSVPQGLRAGETIPDGSIKVRIGKISATILTQNRMVSEQREITVPAGTFDCFLIKENQVTRQPVVGPRTERIETWYAAGIGCVKQAVYDRKGRLDHTQELVSVKFE
ncbi:MAG TPA: hypothetical protein IAC04_06600 [Candidatus Coprenecus stercoravium]|uniref:DUF3108 domain-containing protein n=1 Tax=Candidatus Coprenecus stercoravium TaxID=2840735 RepID=A0A9D2GQ49_9BACT|nr:hypothetical protein [Candidatus Coprenecus stercoravium]